jgi:hypothetical protein
MLSAVSWTAVSSGLQVVLICGLYRLRISGVWAPASSDVLVFILPSLLSVIAASAVFWRSGLLGGYPVVRGLVAVVWGLVVVAIGLECALVLAFNSWGT